MKPEYSEALVNLAIEQSDMGNVKEAIANFKGAL